jgi:amino acid adenylation domain-containing protein
MRCRLAIPLGSEDRAAFISISPATRLPQADIQFEDAAYVAFTSGTTGNSKAVLGTHGPLSHFLRWHTETFGFGPGDRFSMLSGLSHDPLLRDIFTPLWSGGAVLVPEPEDMAMPGGLAAWLRRERITVAHLTPAMSGLLQTGGDEGSLPDLRYAFFGADILTERDVARICRRAPQATVVNFYGTTETPQAMSYWVMPPIPARAGDEGRGRIPLGRGIEGAQLLVLNRARSLAGIGELGEIHIRSPYLAAGYLDDDALQEDRFLPNPMTASQGDRMYRTGDLGCYRPDGAVEFAARADDQVKIRGYRVEPGQVEAALCRHPGLRQCHVAAQRGPDGNSRLIGYVVPADGAIPTSGELYEFLRERLPDYMVPSAFVLLPALPLTPNGKLDRRTLPQPELAIFAPTRGPATPLAGMEEALAGMWTDLLGVSGVGADDNFFASGGHSLLATQLLWRIRQRFEVDLPVRRLFEHPTPAGLAEAIRLAQRDGEKQSVPALERAARVPQRGGPTQALKES